jgi:hypothetical protein
MLWRVSMMSRSLGATLPRHPAADMKGVRGAGDATFLAVALTKLMLMERSGILPPLDMLAQNTLDRILYAQSTHYADAHGGQHTVQADCNTCVALYEAVSAARIAAVETTPPPKRAAQTQTRPTRKGSV